MRTKREQKDGRNRKKLRLRKRVQGSTERPRICVFKSAKYTYAQIISDESHATLVSASTQQDEVLKVMASIKSEDLKGSARSTKSVAAARALGLEIARKAKAANITSVVFDRNGYLYSGRIQAVAEGAREGGLDF